MTAHAHITTLTDELARTDSARGAASTGRSGSVVRSGSAGRAGRSEGATRADRQLRAQMRLESRRARTIVPSSSGASTASHGALCREALGPEALGPEALGPEALGPEALGPEALGGASPRSGDRAVDVFDPETLASEGAGSRIDAAAARHAGTPRDRTVKRVVLRRVVPQPPARRHAREEALGSSVSGARVAVVSRTGGSTSATGPSAPLPRTAPTITSALRTSAATCEPREWFDAGERVEFQRARTLAISHYAFALFVFGGMFFV